MPTIYPDCMMPDGAEPCGGYRQLYEQHTALAARLAEAEALLREARPWVCWCRDMIRRTDDPEDVKLHADATLASIDAFLAADSSRGDDE